MKVGDLVAAMERIAPLAGAESWDNVGLLVGWADRDLTGPVTLTIDMTEAVVQEAAERGAGAIVAYHPPIFGPINRLDGSDPGVRAVLMAAERKMAVYSPHTALDAAVGGVTDWLCECLAGEQGLAGGDRRALEPIEALTGSQQVKIVTFLPAGDADRVREALASAGAGIIGKYRVCSFATGGTGTFLGEEGSNPAVGQPGRLERVEEVRLEMVCSESALALALQTLDRFHPYEQPGTDVYPLHPQPSRWAGAGRRFVLDQPASLRELVDRLKAHLDVARIRVGAPEGLDQCVTHVGACPGAGASLAESARNAGCEVFVTGEMSHHQVLGAMHSGMAVILAGHSNTERGYLPRLGDRLSHELNGIEAIVSRLDRDPLVST